MDHNGMTYNVDFKTIGQKIKAARERAGLTQEKLAAMIRYSDQSISLWENDHVKPHERAIRDLEKAFGIKLRK